MAADVTVVVPTRNRYGLLRRTLASILAQREARFDVVVVDEASEDGTPELLARLGDPRVSSVRHERPLGVAAARNAGLARARGAWVAFADDDDLWAPEKLATQLQALSGASAGWSCTAAVVVDERLRILAHEAAPPADVLEPLRLRNVVPGGGSSVVAATALVRRLGGFDERLHVLADWELWIRLALSAPLAPVAAPLVAYLRHRAGISRDLSELDAELAYVEAKHRDVFPGGRLDWEGWREWQAVQSRRSGRRTEAARAYVARLRARPRPRDAARLLLALAWPGFVTLRERLEARRVPPGVRAEAERWLGPLSAGRR